LRSVINLSISENNLGFLRNNSYLILLDQIVTSQIYLCQNVININVNFVQQKLLHRIFWALKLLGNVKKNGIMNYL